MFMSVYISEYCNETWQTLTVDWDYDQFLEMYNNVMYFTELKQAVHLDDEREESARRAKEEAAAKSKRRGF